METSLTTAPNPQPQVLARVVDWERIEIQYSAGTMSTREIATEHGISHTAINKRAKAEKWTRRLAAKVHAKADAKVSRALVSSVTNGNQQLTEQQTIELESDRVAAVRIGHTKMAARGYALCEALMAELEAQTFDKVLMSELGKMMRKPDGETGDRLNDLYKKVISMPGRVDTAKKLIETMKSVISMEREAYGIDTLPAAAPVDAIGQFIASMKRSALPVVYEVERDDTL